MQGENGSLQQKLQECSQQLQSSEQMIRWLNDQARRLGFFYKSQSHSAKAMCVQLVFAAVE